MEIKIGDSVRFLNSVGGGIVVKIVNQTLVEVRDDNGFNYPVLKTDVVVIPKESVQKSPNKTAKEVVVVKEEAVEIKQLEPESDQEIAGNDIPKIHCALVPDSLSLDEFDLYIINDCNYHFLYNISEKKGDLYINVESGLIESNNKVYIKTYKRNTIQDNISLCFQGTLYKRKPYSLTNPIQKTIEFVAVKLFKNGVFKPNDFLKSRLMF
ncbi:MAG: DUF2027 domain-containing protein [Bacteroidales bacterium]|nr:DUF2027 domain-containing protein [Bacteroidales bacterium]